MLILAQYRLINGHDFDAVPAALYRAKANARARQLAGSDWLIRDKSDGTHVAVLTDGSLRFFRRLGLQRRRLQGIQDLLLQAGQVQDQRMTPAGLQPMLHGLGLDPEAYSAHTGLHAIAEPPQLEFAGTDRYRRPLWLDYDTGKAWQRMRRAAMRDAISLDAISGFRSCHYQAGIFRRKLARGLTLEDILRVNAAPGFSEHHSGRAIDIGTRGEPPAEQSFEHTPAFAWLAGNAERFGFRMSFPRDNPYGIGYEPWHWYWTG
jgi:zinc D-Ala-D-Ala carboxypeptidase